MDGWLVWLIVAVVVGVVELVTLTAALGVVAAAALVTAVFTGIGLPLPFQLAVFTAASATGVLLIRPAVHRFMQQPPLARFGVDALIGKSAYVLKEVTGLDGRVRIGGEEWSARACDDTMVIPEG